MPRQRDRGSRGSLSTPLLPGAGSDGAGTEALGRSQSVVKLPPVEGKPLNFQDFYTASCQRVKGNDASRRLQAHRTVGDRLKELVWGDGAYSGAGSPLHRRPLAGAYSFAYPGAAGWPGGVGAHAIPTTFYPELTEDELAWAERTVESASSHLTPRQRPAGFDGSPRLPWAQPKSGSRGGNRKSRKLTLTGAKGLHRLSALGGAGVAKARKAEEAAAAAAAAAADADEGAGDSSADAGDEGDQPVNTGRRMSVREVARRALVSKIERALDFPGLMEQIDHRTTFTSQNTKVVGQRQARLRGAFKRFLPRNSTELNIEDVHLVLGHLGHHVYEEEVQTAIKAVTQYPSIDFSEFVLILEEYVKLEKKQVLAVFNEFDKDKTQKINQQELTSFLQHIAVMPLTKTLEEATQIADMDHNSTLDFEEFATLLIVYRCTEGFASDELEQLRSAFDRFAVDPPALEEDAPCERKALHENQGKVLDTDELWQALLFMFRPTTEEMRTCLADTVAAVSAARTSPGSPTSDSPVVAKTDPQEDKVDFSEFLRIARTVREAEVRAYQQVFNDHQIEESDGNIDESGLRDVIKSLGMLPLRVVIEDFMTQADIDGNGTLDFVEFSNLMICFRSSYGFTHKQVNDLRTIFNCYAVPTGDSGERAVSCHQLMDVLSHLGRVVTLDEVKRLSANVDFDERGVLDYHKFLHLMRMKRDSELDQMQAVFSELAEEEDGEKRLSLGADGTVDKDVVIEALEALGYSLQSGEEEEQEALEIARSSNASHFDGFVEVVDAVRGRRAKALQLVAGFSEARVAQLRALFESYDDDHNQYVEYEELTALLKDLQIPLRTKEEQRSVIDLLAEARHAAVVSGVPEEELPQAVECRVTFPWLLHLFRMLQTRVEKDAQALENEAAKETGFSATEVVDFKEIFDHWLTKQASRRNSVVSTLDEDVPDELGEPPTHLNEVGVRRVLRSLKVSLDRAQMEELTAKMSTMHSSIGQTPPAILFPDFLRLMYWMLQTNFAGIKDASATE